MAVVNDDMEHGDYGRMTLSWEILDAGGHRLAAGGSVRLPALPYYGNVRADVTIAVPENPPAERVAAVLRLVVENGSTTVSENRYDVVIANRAYVAARSAGESGGVWLYDPTGATRPSLDTVGLRYTTVAGLVAGRPALLIIGKDAVDDDVLTANPHDYTDAGGRMVILKGGDRTRELFPVDLADVKTVDGEVVTPIRDDAAVFAGMDPMDMRWWRHDDGSKPYVTHTAMRFDQWNAVNIARLGVYTAPNWPTTTPSFDERSGYPIFLKKTRPDADSYIVVPELTTATSAAVDPLAGKLLADLSSVPLDPPPPTWDGFTESFENGLGAWSVGKGTLVASTANAHTGTYSLGKNTPGAGVIYRWDYTSGAAVTMSIDGQQIATAAGLATFSTIALGDWWGVSSQAGVEFIDDITVITAS